VTLMAGAGLTIDPSAAFDPTDVDAGMLLFPQSGSDGLP
jgi:hypothetical protein